MIVRLSGIVLACLIGFPVGQAVAQDRYPYQPRIPETYYPPDLPPGYHPRAYVRRLPPGQSDEGDLVVIERRPGFGIYSERRYYRVVPGPYTDDDVRPARPFFPGSQYSRSAPEYDRTAPEDRREYRSRAAPEQQRWGARAAPEERREYGNWAAPEERRWGGRTAPADSGSDDRYAGLPPATDYRSLPPGAERPSAVPPSDSGAGGAAGLAPRLRRQVVNYATKEPTGTIIVDTRNTYLYLVIGGGQAMRYGIGVGREGFTWAGSEKISRMAEWPDWYPPKDMIERQPHLPRMMAGGPGNPLGARALYLGNTLYRIHGTNDASSIGQYVSSGCIRLLNEDIEDLYSRVQVGSRVVVLQGGRPPRTASSAR